MTLIFSSKNRVLFNTEKSNQLLKLDYSKRFTTLLQYEKLYKQGRTSYKEYLSKKGTSKAIKNLVLKRDVNTNLRTYKSTTAMKFCYARQRFVRSDIGPNTKRIWCAARNTCKASDARVARSAPNRRVHATPSVMPLPLPLPGGHEHGHAFGEAKRSKQLQSSANKSTCVQSSALLCASRKKLCTCTQGALYARSFVRKQICTHTLPFTENDASSYKSKICTHKKGAERMDSSCKACQKGMKSEFFTQEDFYNVKKNKAISLILNNLASLKEKVAAIKIFVPKITIWGFAFSSSFLLISISSILQRQEQDRWFLTFSRSQMPGLYLTSEKSSWECFENITLKYLSRKKPVYGYPAYKNLLKQIDCYKDIWYLYFSEFWNQQAIKNYTALFSGSLQKQKKFFKNKSLNKNLSLSKKWIVQPLYQMHSQLPPRKVVFKKIQEKRHKNLFAPLLCIEDASPSFLCIEDASPSDPLRVASSMHKKEGDASSYKSTCVQSSLQSSALQLLCASRKKLCTCTHTLWGKKRGDEHSDSLNFKKGKKTLFKINEYKERVSLENDSIPSKMSSSTIFDSLSYIQSPHKGKKICNPNNTYIHAKNDILKNLFYEFDNFSIEPKAFDAHLTPTESLYDFSISLIPSSLKLKNANKTLKSKAFSFLRKQKKFKKCISSDNDSSCEQAIHFLRASGKNGEKEIDASTFSFLQQENFFKNSIESCPCPCPEGMGMGMGMGMDMDMEALQGVQVQSKASKCKATRTTGKRTTAKRSFARSFVRKQIYDLYARSFARKKLCTQVDLFAQHDKITFGYPLYQLKNSQLQRNPLETKALKKYRSYFSSAQKFVVARGNARVEKKGTPFFCKCKPRGIKGENLQINSNQNFKLSSSEIDIKCATTAYTNLKPILEKSGDKISSYFLFKRNSISNRFMSGYQKPEVKKFQVQNNLFVRRLLRKEDLASMSSDLSSISIFLPPAFPFYESKLKGLSKRDCTSFLVHRRPLSLVARNTFTCPTKYKSSCKEEQRNQRFVRRGTISGVDKASCYKSPCVQVQSKELCTQENLYAYARDKATELNRPVIKSKQALRKMQYRLLSLNERQEVEPLFEQVNKTFRISPYHFVFKKSLFTNYNDYLSWQKDTPLAISILPSIEEEEAIKNSEIALSPFFTPPPFTEDHTKGDVKGSSPFAKEIHTPSLQKRFSQQSDNENSIVQNQMSELAGSAPTEQEEEEISTGVQALSKEVPSSTLGSAPTEQEEEEKKREITKFEWLQQIRESEQVVEKRKDLKKLAYPNKKALLSKDLQGQPGTLPKKLVSDRKVSFFGITNLFPKRLISEEQKQINSQILRDEQTQRFVSSLKRLNKKNNEERFSNSQPFSSIRLVPRNRQKDNEVNFLETPIAPDTYNNRKKLCTQAQEGGGMDMAMHSKICRQEDLYAYARKKSECAQKVRSKIFTREHPIYTPNRRLRLRAAQSSLSSQSNNFQSRIDDLNLSQSHRWWQKRRIASSLLGAPSKRYLVMPEIKTQDWRKIIEWQLKTYFFEEEKRLEPLLLEKNSLSIKEKSLLLATNLPFFSNNENGIFSNSFAPTEHKDNSFAPTEHKDNSFAPTEQKDNSFAPTEHKDNSFAPTEQKDSTFLTPLTKSDVKRGIEAKDLFKIKKIAIYLPWTTLKKSLKKPFEWPVTGLSYASSFQQYKVKGNNKDLLSQSTQNKIFQNQDSAIKRRFYNSNTDFFLQSFVKNKQNYSCFIASKNPHFKTFPFFLSKQTDFCPPYASEKISSNSEKMSLFKDKITDLDNCALHTVGDTVGDTVGEARSLDVKFFSVPPSRKAGILPKSQRKAFLKGLHQSSVYRAFLFEAPTKNSYLALHGLALAVAIKQLFDLLYKVVGKTLMAKLKNSSLSLLLLPLFFNASSRRNQISSFAHIKKRLKDLAGNEDTISSLSEIVWYLRNSCRGRMIPRGVVLVETDSSESTEFLKAIGGEAKVPVIVQSLRALPFTQNHPQRHLEKILTFAQKQAPCILFLDDLDSIGQSRSLLLKKDNGALATSSAAHASNGRAKLLTRASYAYSKKRSESEQLQSGANKSPICTQGALYANKSTCVQSSLRTNRRFVRPALQLLCASRKKLCTCTQGTLYANKSTSICTCTQEALHVSATPVIKAKTKEPHRSLKGKLLRDTSKTCFRSKESVNSHQPSQASKNSSYNSNRCFLKNNLLNLSKERLPTQNGGNLFSSFGEYACKSMSCKKIEPKSTELPETEKLIKQRRVDLMLRLLTVMDGVGGLNGVLIVTSSKNPSSLDPALLRPGRFEKLINLKLPSKKKRILFLKANTSKIGHTNSMPWEYFGTQTQDMTGTEMASAINHSAFRAIIQSTVHTFSTLEYGINCVNGNGLFADNSEIQFESKSSLPQKQNIPFSVLKGVVLAAPFAKGLQRTEFSKKKSYAKKGRKLFFQRAFYQAGTCLFQLQSNKKNRYFSPITVDFDKEKHEAFTEMYTNEDFSLRKTSFAQDMICLYAGQASLLLYLNSIARFKEKRFSRSFIASICDRKKIKALHYSLKKRKSGNGATSFFSERKQLGFLRSSFGYKERLRAFSIFQDTTASFFKDACWSGWNNYPYLRKHLQSNRDNKAFYDIAGRDFWWGKKISENLALFKRPLGNWYRLYLPKIEQNKNNREWLLSDQFFNQHVSFLKQDVMIQNLIQNNIKNCVLAHNRFFRFTSPKPTAFAYKSNISSALRETSPSFVRMPTNLRAHLHLARRRVRARASKVLQAQGADAYFYKSSYKTELYTIREKKADRKKRMRMQPCKCKDKYKYKSKICKKICAQTDLSYYNMVLSCFYVAFQNCAENRELLDFLADHLIRFKVLKLHEIIRIALFY